MKWIEAVKSYFKNIPFFHNVQRDYEKVRDYMYPKEKEEQSRYVKFFLWVRGIKKSKKKQILYLALTTLIISLYISGLITQISLVRRGTIAQVLGNPIYNGYIIISYFGNCIVPALIFSALTGYGAFILYRSFHLDYWRDKERNILVANDATYGDAHFMTSEEETKVLERCKNPADVKGDIIGIDKYGYTVARKSASFTNDNVIIIGPPGSGKSTCILNNDILQIIKRGESGIIVDTKGVVYRDTEYAAEKAGYVVKVYNLKPGSLIHSDACDYFTVFDNVEDPNDAKGIANSLANTIMMNINAMENAEIKRDVWFKGAFNLLKAMILIIYYDQTLPREERTLGTMYMTLVENATWQDLEAQYSYVKDDINHPAYEAFKTFAGERDVVKESVLGGLITDLNILADNNARAITSHDEIDFRLPGFQKCIYYLIIDDQDKSNNVLAALFMECLSMELKKAADSQKSFEVEKKLPVLVSFLIDEFKNVGKFQGMGEKLSTYRSRGMLIKIIIQDISQLQQMYPRDQWRELIADCTTMIVLKVGETGGTAQYVSDEMGTMTVMVENDRDSRNKWRLIHVMRDYQKTLGKGERELMKPDEVKKLDKFKLILLIDGESPVILQKFFWTNHPMVGILHLQSQSKKRLAEDHIPEWYKKQQDYKQAEIQKQEEIRRRTIEVGANQMTSVNISSKGTSVKPSFSSVKKVALPQGRMKGYEKSNKL